MSQQQPPDRAQPPPGLPPEIDTGTPHSARVWNYFLGGKDHYRADREAGDRVRELVPEIVDGARADRLFLIRSVRHLVAEAGMRQFLDVGTGIPTADNTHEVAQSVAPDCRVVYVDNDPIVLAHARALLVGSEQGATDYIDADARDPAAVLQAAARTLDFDRPVVVMLLGILNHILDDDQAHATVDRLLDAVPSGSHLVISHPTQEVHGDAVTEAFRLWNEAGGTPLKARSRAELARFFERLELLEPGVVSCSRWRPDPNDLGGLPPEVHQFCGVARKP